MNPPRLRWYGSGWTAFDTDESDGIGEDDVEQAELSCVPECTLGSPFAVSECSDAFLSLQLFFDSVCNGVRGDGEARPFTQSLYSC